MAHSMRVDHFEIIFLKLLYPMDQLAFCLFEILKPSKGAMIGLQGKIFAQEVRSEVHCGSMQRLLGAPCEWCSIYIPLCSARGWHMLPHALGHLLELELR